MWWFRTSTPIRTPTTPCPWTLAHSSFEPLGRSLHRRVVGRRRHPDLALAPVPHTEGHGRHRHATHKIDRLPAGRVQEQRLVDREVRRDPPFGVGRWRRGQGLGTAEHLGLHVEGDVLTHDRRTVGRGEGTTSKSLKRRTRFPRMVQSMTSSPWASSRFSTSIWTPCRASPTKLLADVLARQLAHRHVRPDHLLYLACLIGVAPATPPFH